MATSNRPFCQRGIAREESGNPHPLLSPLSFCRTITQIHDSSRATHCVTALKAKLTPADMGSGESTTRKVSFGVDDEDRVRILRGVKVMLMHLASD